MVKNSTGGNKAKGFARKNQSSGNNTEKLRLPTCDLEKYACVNKLFGNGMCEIYLNDNTRLIGHIRNKFSGSRKRNNLIKQFSVVMVGLREWENPRKNCDILCTVEDIQIEQLKQLPNIEIKNILQMKFTNETQSKEEITKSNLDFTNETDEDEIRPQMNVERFDLETIDEVDIDDI
jgi:translation initiation factor IF-1